MADLSMLPKELDFLRAHIRDGGPRYREASWLKVPFDAAVWHLFTIFKTVIDWQVPVGRERILLTSIRLAGLLEVFRSWLILQTHVDATGGVLLSATSQHRQIHMAMDCIDYLLLNADRLGLTEYGLEGLSANDYCAALAQMLSDPWTTNAVYQWPTRIAEYLRYQMTSVDEIDVANAIAKAPFLGRDIPDKEDRVSDLTDSEIVRARVWLWRQRRYCQRRGGNAGFRYVPDLPPIVGEIYSNTIGGKSGWTSVTELNVEPGHRVLFEYPKAPIRTEAGDGVSVNRIRKYRRVWTSLHILRTSGLPVSPIPHEDLKNLAKTIHAKSDGRFRTLKHDIVFHALRKSLEFSLEHGRHLVESYTNVAIAARNAGMTINVFAERVGVDAFLTEETARLGVRKWVIEPCSAGSGVIKDAPRPLSSTEYFQKLRQNYGLHELLLVLFGSIEVALGTLSARRQGELIDLICGKCLDASRSSLIFELRKSGTMGHRQTVHRPVPPIAAKLIGILEGMQDRLLQEGLIPERTNLFSTPAQRGKKSLVTVCSESYNEAIDYFCDYIQMPLNQQGQRHYIRTHQLRRFFAMLFFWGAGFGGLDALRYYLGHSNIEHLWHYITESIPGAVLRGVQAQWAAHSLQEDRAETRQFADLLETQFGTRNFQLMDSEVLAEHIEDLIESGEVAVEPQFLDGGREYRIAVLIKSRLSA